MERLGLNDEKLDQLRNSKADEMLADVKKLASTGANLNAKNADGAALLHIAACNGFANVVLFLLQQPKIDVNVRDKDGNTAIHLAAYYLQYECVMHLGQARADLQARNREFQKPIVMTEDATMIRLLSSLEKNAQVRGAPWPSPCLMSPVLRLPAASQPQLQTRAPVR